MTIAVSLKVNEGVVFATDSASTLSIVNGATGQLTGQNVYNSAAKLFNLYKGLPIGAMTWGQGNIRHASISTLMKDLRRRFAGQDEDHDDWTLVPAGYDLGEIADRVREFMYEEQYKPAFKKAAQKPVVGFAVAGYSAGAELPELYEIVVDKNGKCPKPRLRRKAEDGGLDWWGQPEAITRIVLGVSGHAEQALIQVAKLNPKEATRVNQALRSSLQAPLVNDAMPLQDGIELAVFLVEATKAFTRFSFGANTVGGPVEVAAITKHEGFKWVRRKHYYDDVLNPPVLDVRVRDDA